MSAVCHRCGGTKAQPLVPCPFCNVIPRGDERPVAWLFSSAHLDEAELKLASERIRSGEIPDPSKSLRTFAARHLQPTRNNQTLTLRQQLGLVALNVGLTPLSGLAVWWGLSAKRPRAAHQALRITVPVMIVFSAIWIGLIATRLFG